MTPATALRRVAGVTPAALQRVAGVALRRIVRGALVAAALALATAAGAQELDSSGARAPSELMLLPMPRSVIGGGGSLALGARLVVELEGSDSPRLDAAIARFLDRIAGLGITGWIAPGGGSRTTAAAPSSGGARAERGATVQLQIRCGRPGRLQLGEDESYRLSVTKAGIRLEAPTDLGALHGLQTLLQLFDPPSMPPSIPYVTINDAPRFTWRGLLIDSARHFLPVSAIERTIDGMEAVKLNVLHWHLSDDQGFRMQSVRYPLLTARGSNGQFYTQTEIREVVAYAGARGVRVVPELDVPSHTTSWFAGYPELATKPGRYAPAKSFGVFDAVMDPTKEATYRFLRGLFTEVASLFPDAYVHIGGDEVTGIEWSRSAAVRTFMRTRGIGSLTDLHGYFSRRVCEILESLGKHAVGWEEMLTPGLPSGTIIDVWNGRSAAAESAEMDQPFIVSRGYYLNVMLDAADYYSIDPAGKAGDSIRAASDGGDPAGAPITGAPQEEIAASSAAAPNDAAEPLGGEASMWGELVDASTIDSRVWPSAAAIAERFWSPAGVRDVPDLYRRLAVENDRLTALGLTQASGYLPKIRALLVRSGISPSDASDRALVPLFDVLEPQQSYQRLSDERITTTTPLDTIADVARPDSAAARELGALVERYLARMGRGAGAMEAEIAPAYSAPELAQLRTRLIELRDDRFRVDAVLGDRLPVLRSFADELSELGRAGLGALNFIESGDRADGGWFREKRAVLARALEPRAGVVLAVAPPIARLVYAAAGRLDQLGASAR